MAALSTCVETILRNLVWLVLFQEFRGLAYRSRDTTLTSEKWLRFFRTFLICMGTSKGIMPEAEAITCRFKNAFNEANDDLAFACHTAAEKYSFWKADQAASNVLVMVQNFQPEVQEAYGILLQQSWQGNNQPDPELLVGLLDSLLDNLTDLVDSKDLIASFQKQIQILKKKLSFLRKFLAITSKQSIPHQIMHFFLTYVHFSALSAAFWSYLCWAYEMNESIAGEMKIMLSDVVQKTMPHTLELVEMYVGLLKASKQAALSSDAKIDEVLFSFAEFLSENSVNFMGKRAATIPENLIFLLSFIIDLQEECTGDLGEISVDIKTVAMEACYLEYKHIVSEATEDQIKKMECAVSKLLKKIKIIGAENHLIELKQSKDHLMVLMRDATAVFHDGLKFLKPCFFDPWVDRKCLLKHVETVVSEITSPIYSIHGKRFTKEMGTKIVMDDVWDIGAWGDLRVSFPDDNNGSRVLFTSRKHDLGSQAKEDGKTFILNRLSDDESWQLLQKRVFREESCPPTLLEIGKRIAEKCEGVPLSLVVIAGLLAITEKSTPDSCKHVLEKLTSYVVADPQGGCMHALEFSYEDLPDQLKSCSLYFGAFPEDEEVPVWKLSSLWIVEGFVHSTDSKSLEDAAEYCLLQLLSRSLVIAAKRRSNGRVKSCQVHDLLRELCFKKAKEENFLRLIHGYDELFASSPHGLDYIVDSDCIVEYHERRLCICSKRNHFTMLKPCGSLHSLFFLATNEKYPRTPNDISFICHNFQLVRVLDFERINMGDFFPIGLELLVQLKYLGGSGDFKSIPSSITELWKLETFLVKASTGEVLLPQSFWNMKRLRRVHINHRVAFSWQIDKLVSSSLLENIETFSTPALSYGGYSEKTLRRLPGLRKPRCISVESSNYISKYITRFPALDFLTRLESLNIFYYSIFPCWKWIRDGFRSC